MNAPQWTDERLAYVALGLLIEPGNRELGDRVAARGSVEALARLHAGVGSETLVGGFASRVGTEDPLRMAERTVAETDRLGARIITPADDEWPLQLADLARIRAVSRERIRRDTMPPLCLWVRGGSPLNDMLRRSVAVVGARAATEYGEFLAAELAYALGGRGWTVVSGGAYGIDTTAHRGALSAHAPTVVVLACGIDRPYPLCNTSLFEQVPETGALISEWPPGTAPHGHRFLIRNRVIAAATVGTVVVEASARSGSLQTLRCARDLGRVQMAMPGPVTSAMSVGCHEALRIEGTRLVTGWPQVLEEVGQIGADLAPEVRGPERLHDRLDSAVSQVRDALPYRGAAGPDQIASTAGVPLRVALNALGVLVAGGYAITRNGGYALPPRSPSTQDEPR